MTFLFFLCVFSAIAVSITTATIGDPARSEGPPALVTVQLQPRSQWDTKKTYEAARIVATRSVRVCQKLDSDGAECIQETDAWTTAVCRDHPWQGYLKEATRSHTLAQPHMFELYRTYDNRTYTEIQLTGMSNILHNHPVPGVNVRDAPQEGEEEEEGNTPLVMDPHGDEEKRMQSLDQIRVRRSSSEPLEPEDFELLELTRIVAYGTNKKMVFRWDMGRLWPIPVEHWNVGERALHTGEYMNVEFVNADTPPLDDRPLYVPSDLYESNKK